VQWLPAEDCFIAVAGFMPANTQSSAQDTSSVLDMVMMSGDEVCGSCMQEGAVHAAKWQSAGDYFAVVAGYRPARIAASATYKPATEGKGHLRGMKPYLCDKRAGRSCT